MGEPLANHWRTIGEPAELLSAVAELAADGARPPAGRSERTLTADEVSAH